MNSIMKQFSAWLPLVMSFGALCLIFGYVMIVGVVNEGGGDERIAARLFQVLMALQLPIMVFFAIKWLPRQPKLAWMILALQTVVALIPIAVILFLENL